MENIDEWVPSDNSDSEYIIVTGGATYRQTNMHLHFRPQWR